MPYFDGVVSIGKNSATSTHCSRPGPLTLSYSLRPPARGVHSCVRVSEQGELGFIAN